MIQMTFFVHGVEFSHGAHENDLAYCIAKELDGLYYSHLLLALYSSAADQVFWV
jgi:hypothetical protein